VVCGPDQLARRGGSVRLRQGGRASDAADHCAECEPGTSSTGRAAEGGTAAALPTLGAVARPSSDEASAVSIMADSKGKGKALAPDEEKRMEELRKAKGKGKLVEEEDEEDEEDFDVDADDEDDDDDDDEDSEEDEEPPEKRPKKEAVGSSKGKAPVGGSSAKPDKKKVKAKKDDDEGEVSSPEIVKNLSGDEVDPSLIIAGGRRARRGRAQFGSGAPGGPRSKYAQAAPDSDDSD